MVWPLRKERKSTKISLTNRIRGTEVAISNIKQQDIMEEYITIHISCKEFHTADFLRQLANTIEEQEECENIHFENENGYADVMY